MHEPWPAWTSTNISGKSSSSQIAVEGKLVDNGKMMTVSRQLVPRIRDAVVACEMEEVVRLVKDGIRQGVDRSRIVNEGLTAGIRVLGARFERGEAYLPELAVAAETMKEALKLLEPHLKTAVKGGGLGTVVIGTVQGDIHEIGKTIVATMLTVAGFTVHDLGVDVPPTQFVAKAREFNADIIAMSALLTTTMDRMRETVELIKQQKLGHRVKVMVGGAPVSTTFAKTIGADGFGVDFNEAVKVAKRLTGHTQASS
jgi:corrinoid protein of di/trimethylamine methyltransferase